MPCLCGDTYCASCGPAQGNYRCYVCGAWSADGGCKDPEACAQKEREWAEAEIQEQKAIEDWKNGLSDEEFRETFGHSRINRRIEP